MREQLKELPDDVATLKKLVHEYHKEAQEKHERAVRAEQRYEQLRRMMFGKKSEKLSLEDETQGRLFDESEAYARFEPVATEKKKAKGSKSKRTRHNKTGAFPPGLPRYDIVHDVKEPLKKCGCGVEREKIGEDVTEKLRIIPENFVVERHIRPKYVCKHCEGSEGKGLVQAPMPPSMIPKGIATAELLAYVFTAKFNDALPFNRLEKIFQRFGIDIARSTLCDWATGTAKKCEGLVELLKRELLNAPLIHIDETTLQVMNEANRKNTSKSYMWVFRAITRDGPVVFFRYQTTRSPSFLRDMLSEFKGIALTDGYRGYNSVLRDLSVEHAGCWVHVRRRFHAAMEGGSSEARNAMDMIGQLYVLEKEWKSEGLSADELLERRRRFSEPVVNEMKNWLDRMSYSVAPRSPLGEGIAYALNEWSKLVVFLKNPNVPLDNNPVENTIRPFVIGRKNWLFSGSPCGADASSTLYTLIENAKANGIDSYWYLNCLFKRLPRAKTEDDLRALLPQYLNREWLENS